MLIKAYLPAIDKQLGIFIPLIVVNCIILARAEMFASKNGPLMSILDGLAWNRFYLVASCYGKRQRDTWKRHMVWNEYYRWNL